MITEQSLRQVIKFIDTYLEVDKETLDFMLHASLEKLKEVNKINEQDKFIKTLSLHLDAALIDNQYYEKEIKRLREYIGQVSERDIVPDNLNH